jgi:hypothetical protein
MKLAEAIELFTLSVVKECARKTPCLMRALQAKGLIP